MLTHPELCPFTALWEVDWKQGPFLESGLESGLESQHHPC